MSELELLREAFVATPEPDESSVQAGRAALQREIERRRQPRHRRSWSAAVVVVVVAALAVVAFLVVPRGNGLTGVEIAAAADRALSPGPHGIWHIVQVVRYDRAPQSRIETWATTGRPYVIVTRTKRPGAALVEEVETACGSAYSRQGTLTLSARPQPRIAGWVPRPIRDYRRALHDKHVRYVGETTFAGVPAYKLVRTLPFHGSATYRSGGVVTTLVRQGSYYPLESVAVYTIQTFEKGSWRTVIERESVTYRTFEFLPRDARTKHLLRIAQRSGVFVIPIRSRNDSPRCVRYLRGLLQHR